MVTVCVVAFHSSIALLYSIGNVDVARPVHRHALRGIQPRRDQGETGLAVR